MSEKETKEETKKEVAKESVFFSKYLHYTLPYIPPRMIKNENGTVAWTVPTRIRFDNGMYVTTNQKEIDYIKNHKSFGDLFTLGLGDRQPAKPLAKQKSTPVNESTAIGKIISKRREHDEKESKEIPNES